MSPSFAWRPRTNFETADYPQLQHDLLEFVERQRPRKLLLDLGNVVYCATALINILLAAQNRVQANAGTMKLCGLREVFLETLQCLKLVGTKFSVSADKDPAHIAF